MIKRLPSNVIGAIAIFISALVYATLPILTKVAYATGLQPFYLLWLRYIFAFLFLMVILFFLKQKIVCFSPMVFIQGVFFILSGVFFFQCLQYLSAGLCSVIFFTYPVMVALLALVFFKEKIGPRLFIGLVLAVSGIILVSGILGDSSVKISLKGIIYCILSSLTYTGHLLIGQKNLKSESSFVLTSTFAFIGIFFIAIFFGRSPGFLAPLTGTQLVISLLIAILNTVIPIVFLLYGISKIGASRGSLISNVEPALSIIMAYLILGEVMTPIQMIGSALVLISMVLALPAEHQDDSISVKLSR
mgnify:FL=1